MINPSGGLISKGHPLGATGLAQCAELVWQLRGRANNRLVEGAARALQHNLGLGGAVVASLYWRADGRPSRAAGSAEVAERSGLGCNPAVEARTITREDADRARSRSCRNEFALGDTQARIDARLWSRTTAPSSAPGRPLARAGGPVMMQWTARSRAGPGTRRARGRGVSERMQRSAAGRVPGRCWSGARAVPERC